MLVLSLWNLSSRCGSGGCLHHQAGPELGPVGVEEPLQGPAHPIVVEQRAAAGRGKPQEAVVTISRPLAEGIERQAFLDALRGTTPSTTDAARRERGSSRTASASRWSTRRQVRKAYEGGAGPACDCAAETRRWSWQRCEGVDHWP
jgi:hypothetical protein